MCVMARLLLHVLAAGIVAMGALPADAQIGRTPDGQPDIQGFWNNSTLTPLERGLLTVTMAERVALPEITSLTVSDEQALAIEKRIAAQASFDRRDGGADLDVSRAYNSLFLDLGTELARVNGVKRTSLIVDPPDGRIPSLTPEAERRQLASRAGFGNVSERPLEERCLVSVGPAAGPPMIPARYNSNYQIIQATGVVMIFAEMIHDTRIVRLGATHAPPSVRQWLGDSIGHWEGDTLVVETTNFNDQTAFRGASPNLRVTERFRRVDAKTLLYHATMEDPSAFTRPWTIEYPFRPTADPLYEYACHEGNYALTGILGGARKADEKSPEE
jgi:hypothetical protein